MWRRKGWAAMDQMREKLEGLKELRDLVRSLGRGGGWGPLRRAPVQVRPPPPELSAFSSPRRCKTRAWRCSHNQLRAVQPVLLQPVSLASGHLRGGMPSQNRHQFGPRGAQAETPMLQYLNMRGRPGLLRTILEAQETRGLTRSDDISRLLPSEVGTDEPAHSSP